MYHLTEWCRAKKIILYVKVDIEQQTGEKSTQKGTY